MTLLTSKGRRPRLDSRPLSSLTYSSTCCLVGWLFSANHFCNRGISTSGSKQIRIRGFEIKNASDGEFADVEFALKSCFSGKRQVRGEDVAAAVKRGCEVGKHPLCCLCCENKSEMQILNPFVVLCSKCHKSRNATVSDIKAANERERCCLVQKKRQITNRAAAFLFPSSRSPLCLCLSLFSPSLPPQFTTRTVGEEEAKRKFLIFGGIFARHSFFANRETLIRKCNNKTRRFGTEDIKSMQSV